MSQERREPFGNAGNVLSRIVDDLQDLRKKADSVGTPDDLKKLRLSRTRTTFEDAVRAARDRIGQAREQHAARLKERSESLRRAAEVRRELVEQTPALRREELEKPKEGKFVLTGRILDAETGDPLPDVKLRVFDLDRKYDDLVAETRTDELGYYRVVYDQSDFEDVDETPEMDIEGLDEQGEAFYTSPRGFRQKSGKVEVLNAALSGENVPSSLDKGKVIAARLKARRKDVGMRSRALSHRADLKGYR